MWDTQSQPAALNSLQKELPHVSFYSGVELSLEQCLALNVKQIILSPGVNSHGPLWQACKKQGISVVGDIELFAQAAPAPIIAITGTNAKGSVTTLVGKMAEASKRKVAVGGNIGTPVLDLLEEENPDLFVLELSSYQLETTNSLQPLASTILNISPDHLDRYSTLQAYQAAKQRIYQRSQHCLYNRNDPLTKPIHVSAETLLSFGLDEPMPGHWGIRQQEGQTYLAYGKECLLPSSALKLPGRHTLLNALAALALGTLAGLHRDAMLQVLTEFPGLPFRCQYITHIDGVAWFNDSKGTNVAATMAAIQCVGETCQGKVILLAGGVGKGADFTPLQAVAKQWVKHAILFGQDAHLLAQALHPVIALTHVNDLKTAVVLAKQLAEPGDVVLLSPACASLDQFRHAEQRGEIFNLAVKELSAQCPP